MRILRSLKRDERGTAIIELAMVAPVLALMTIGVVDLSNAFGRKMQLEQAAHRAIEKVMNTTGVDTVESTIIAEAAAQAKVTTDKVKVEFRLECAGALTAGVECPEGVHEEKWISVEVKDSYTPMFPVRFSGINSDGTYHLTSKAGMRVE